MPNFQQFIDPELNTGDVVHSSAYAAAARGGKIGSTGTPTSGLSIEKRRDLMHNARIIGSYRHSKIGRLGSSLKARTAGQENQRIYDASRDTFASTTDPASRQNNNTKTRQQTSTSTPSVPRQRFSEPPSRGFNPYS